MQKTTFWKDIQFWFLFFLLGILWLFQYFWEKPFIPYIAETVPPYDISPVPESVKKSLPSSKTQESTPINTEATLITPQVPAAEQKIKPLQK